LSVSDVGKSYIAAMDKHVYAIKLDKGDNQRENAHNSLLNRDPTIKIVGFVSKDFFVPKT